MGYTNSPLVEYTRISPNRTSPRNHVIDTISIHCYVGQVTCERGANGFVNPAAEASSNYIIGYDGRISMAVEEKDRSWCTSSPSNDHRAVTIEVASDAYAPYAVTDAAYQSLIKLCADICKRNDIKKLIWSTNKSDRVNHKNGCNMTVHRDYANKSCPGDYLYNRHNDIASKVNELLNGETIPEEKPAETPVKPNGIVPNIYYAVKTKKYGILPFVKNREDYAGWADDEIIAVAIRVDSGRVVYRVHTVAGEWLPEVSGCDWNDFINGYAGDDVNAIDAIEIVFYTDAKETGGVYYKAVYQVKGKNFANYWPKQYDDEISDTQDGYAGVYRIPMTKLLIGLEKC